MTNSISKSIIQFLKDRNKFALLEAGLLTASFIFFKLEEGYWVFTSFFAILAALFYIGVNYDKLFGRFSNAQKVQNNQAGFLDQGLFYELEKISESAQNSIKNIDEIKKELNNMTDVLEKTKNRI